MYPRADLTPSQLPCVLRTEFRTRLSNCFVRNDDPTLREEIFHIAEAQTETIVVPDCVTDDFGGESVSVVRGSMAIHGFSLPATRQLDNAPPWNRKSLAGGLAEISHDDPVDELDEMLGITIIGGS